MNIEKERKAFESSELVKTIIHKFEWSDGFNNYQIKDCVINGNVFDFIEAENDQPILNGAWFGWQAAKAQAVPNTQALHDRLLVKSIREHVESHIAEISVADLFDKGWFAAMKCIQNDIDMLEAQEQSNESN